MPWLGLLAVAKPAYLLAALGSCTPEAPPALRFHFIEDKAVWHHDKTSKQLARMSPGTARFPVVAGLTITEISDQYRGEVLIRERAADHMQCVWPAEMKIDIRLKFDVYVASDLLPGRCGEQETERHEQRHVDASRDEMRRNWEGLRRIALAALKKPIFAGPLPSGSDYAVRVKMMKNVSGAVHAKVEAVRKHLAVRQSEIDTDAEYAHFSSACPNEPLFRGR